MLRDASCMLKPEVPASFRRQGNAAAALSQLGYEQITTHEAAQGVFGRAGRNDVWLGGLFMVWRYAFPSLEMEIPS